MKKRFLPIAVAATALVSVSAAFGAKNNADSDPVVMKVNGKPVLLSEFEYLYNKNNSQQVEPTTVDQYVDMFSVYKMKVAEAEAAGVDTTSQFVDEYNKYRVELAEPYMTDAWVEDSLVNEIYDHMKRNRDVYYIMMFGGRTPEEQAAKRQQLDSVRTEIVNGADFAELADRFSVDRNGGHMGYMKANRFPYAFEQAVYATPIGEISDVKELKGFGYFIVKPVSERPDPGQVKARHLLKMTRGLSDKDRATRKAQIDSLYIVLKNGGDFAQIARSESQDPGSSTKGGMLPWFGVGDMVPAFENAAFALGINEISEPIETPYGYHIIMKTDARDAVPFDEAKEAILANIKNDYRGQMANQHCIDRYKQQYKAKLNAKTIKEVSKLIDKAPEVNESLLESLQKNVKPIASVGKKTITVAEAAANIRLVPGMTAAQLKDALQNQAESLLTTATRDMALDNLSNTNPEYRNLINEYRDGMLLFEVSNNNVWDKAIKDTEGLESYFNANRAKYSTWDKPRFKGEVVFAKNDSILALAKEFLADKNFDHEKLVKVMKSKYGKNVKVESVLAPQGSNAIIDYLAFDGPEPTASKSWPVFFAYNGKVIDQPQEAADVKGAVTADYQQLLEDAWVKSLREKYPIEVYPDALKNVKSQVE